MVHINVLHMYDYHTSICMFTTDCFIREYSVKLINFVWEDQKVKLDFLFHNLQFRSK